MASRRYVGMPYFFMKIGIISDSHDNVPLVKKAVDLFNIKQVELVIHAGDYIAPFSVKELLKLKSGFIGVFGNNDGEKEGIRNVCKNIFEAPYTFELNSKKITVIHDIGKLEASLKHISDIVIYGHTHKAEIKKGKPLFINPGECGGWINGISTVVIFDFDKMAGEIVKIS